MGLRFLEVWVFDTPIGSEISIHLVGLSFQCTQWVWVFRGLRSEFSSSEFSWHPQNVRIERSGIYCNIWILNRNFCAKRRISGNDCTVEKKDLTNIYINVKFRARFGCSEKHLDFVLLPVVVGYVYIGCIVHMWETVKTSIFGCILHSTLKITSLLSQYENWSVFNVFFGALSEDN